MTRHVLCDKIVRCFTTCVASVQISRRDDGFELALKKRYRETNNQPSTCQASCKLQVVTAPKQSAVLAAAIVDLSAWFLQLVDNLPRRIPDFPVSLSSQSGNFTSCSFIYQLYKTTFSHLILVSSSSSLLHHILLHLLFRIFILTDRIFVQKRPRNKLLRVWPD